MGFILLVQHLSPRLKAIAYRLNHSFTFFNEEDLYQEALIHLWEGFKAKTLADKTESYILQGCYFHLKNYIRTHKDKFNTVGIEGQRDEDKIYRRDYLVLKDEKAEHYFDYLNDKLLAEVIRNNGLTAREKELLPLFAEGLTTREIGRRLRVSHVWIVKMRREIRRKCEKYLDKF